MVLIFLLTFFVFQPARAAVVREISYQGKLLDSTGRLVTDGNYDIMLRIYDAPSGGNCVWSMRGTCGSPAARSVTVTRGIFSIMMGDTAVGDNAINLDFNTTYYLGVQIGTDTEMTPRKTMGATPAAFNSDLLDGLDAKENGVDAHVVKTNAAGDIDTSGTYRIGGVDFGQFFIDSAGTLGQLWSSDGTGRGTWLNLSAIDHGSLGGLADDDHTQYALLDGRSGGQLMIGGTQANDTFVIQGNSAAAGNTDANTAIEFKVGDSGSTTALIMRNDGTLDFGNNETIGLRIENADGSVLSPSCDGTTLGRMYYDTSAGAAFVCIESAPGVYGWFDYTTTTVQSNKVVTVGTGGDYTSISAGAGYLNALGGGIILLTPETHNVTSAVDLENISLIGANTGDTRINITGAGRMRVKETQFKSMTIYVDAGISAASGIDAKYAAATTTSIIFEWVDFITNGTKVLINSTDATAPTVRTRFISTSTTSGTQKIFLPTATANLNSASTHFVESQGGAGALDIEDWDVKIAGSSNVKTTGTIETIPDSTIFVYPGMNLQGAINSIASGGVITLLPGVHNISSTILIARDDIQIEGYGDASIVRASGIATGDTIAAIQIGAVNGSAPNDGVVLRDFKLEVSGTGATDVHGIRVSGGEDDQIQNISVIKTTGASGTAATAHMGILMMDGTAERLIRPVIKGSRVLGTSSAGAYFTDGIHVTGGASYGAGSGIWTNGQGIDGALVDGNYVDYVRETVAVFVGVNNSSLYNNRFSRMGVGGGGAFGVFFGNSSNVNMTANVVATSLSAASYGIVIDTINSGSLKQVTDSVFTANTIDGSANGGVGFGWGVNIGNAANTAFHRNEFTNNVINGASNATTYGININGNADDNNFSNNIINGVNNPWDTGITVVSNTAERNYFGKNAFINTTVNYADAGTASQMGMSQHNATAAPTANDDSADGYAVGAVWVNTSTSNAYIATSVAVGAATWEQIDAVGGGSADLDIAYTNDADKVMSVNNAAGLEFTSSTAGNIAFDLQSTGDFVLQDNNATFFTISDTGGLDYTLDATDNPSFAVTNLGTGSFTVADQAGDTTPFIIDQNGNVGIGTNAPNEALDVNGRMYLTPSSAPGTTTDRLYNIGGALYWNGTDIIAGLLPSGTTGQTLRHNGTNWVADSTLYNDGTNVGIGSTTGTDKLNIDQTATTASLNGLGISYSQGSNAADIAAAALRVLATSSGDAGDTLYGLNIDTITPTNSTEIGLRFGTGWDYELAFDDSTPNIRIADGAVLGISDGTNNLLEAKDLNTNFGIALSAGAFMDRNSTIIEEFYKMRTTVTADTTGGNDVGMGDGGGWGAYEGNCTFSYVPDAVNGITRMQANAANNGCLMMVDEAANNRADIIDADNLPVFLMKVRPNNVSVTNRLFVGMADQTDGATTDPANFIGFTNNAGTTWTGRTTNGGASTNVTCSGQTISTTNFALLMIEVRATNDVRFYVDNDVTDGIDFTSCGTSATNIPTTNYAPELIYQSRAGGTANTYLDVDFYRVWQDDAADGTPAKPIDIAKVEADFATDSSLTQMYPVKDNKTIPAGALVEDDPKTSEHQISPAEEPENIVGVVVDTAGVELGNGTIDGVRVATYGRTNVKVNEDNGPIYAGDYLSVSDKAGVAAKAKDSGIVLGRAMEDFDPAKKDKSILVNISIQRVNLDTEGLLVTKKDNASMKLDLELMKNLQVKGGININGPSEFTGKTTFQSFAEFFGKVVMQGETQFTENPTFNSDTVGFAEIKKGDRSVTVSFSKELSITPVVQATISLSDASESESKAILQSDLKYIIANQNRKGFSIELNQPATADIRFSWSAFSPESKKTTATDLNGSVLKATE